MSNSQNQPLKLPALLGLAFAVAGALLSGLLVCKHLGVCVSSMGCTLETGVDGCKALGESKHSKLFGIPIAIFGLFYYLLIGLVLFQASRATGEKVKGAVNLVLSFAVFGLVVDLALGYKNFFVLLHPCKLCAYTYLTQIGIMGAAVWMYFASGKDLGTGADFGQAFKGAVIPIALAGIGTGIVAIVMLMGGKKSNVEKGPDLHVPFPAAKTTDRLREFRSFKKVQLSSAGINQVEGPAKAYITIHKFADFRCGHCFNAGQVLQAALQRWPGRIKVYYRHFPLDGTCNRAVKRKQPGGQSCNGAQAAICAAPQKIFAKVYHGIFGFQQSGTGITPTNLKGLVSRLGGDWSSMLACMGSASTARAINRDVADAIKLDIQSTPTITVNGHMLPPGTPDVVHFFSVLDSLVYEKEGQAAYDEMKKRMAELKKSGKSLIPSGGHGKGHGHGHDHGDHSGHSH